MSHHGSIAHMTEAHPQSSAQDNPKLEELISHLIECAAVCTACADACLGEEDVAHMRACIRTDLDCADICAATARVIGRQTATDQAIVKAMLQACATACQRCGSECSKHAEMMEHCKICADVCRKCADACADFIA